MTLIITRATCLHQLTLTLPAALYVLCGIVWPACRVVSLPALDRLSSIPLPPSLSSPPPDCLPLSSLTDPSPLSRTRHGSTALTRWHPQHIEPQQTITPPRHCSTYASLVPHLTPPSHSSVRAVSAYADEMYLAWKDNPESVHKSWDAYFKTGQYTAPPGLYEQYKPLQKEAAQAGGQQRQQPTTGGAQGESA